jgi:hypothetical protein
MTGLWLRKFSWRRWYLSGPCINLILFQTDDIELISVGKLTEF